MRWRFLLVALTACTSFGVDAPGNAPDASVPDSNVRDAVDAGSVSPCTGTFLVCDEFERSDVIAGIWLGVVHADQNGPDNDPAIGTPPVPHSGEALHFSVGANGGTSSHEFLNTLNQRLAGATLLTVDFDVLPLGPSRQIDLFTFVLVATGGNTQYVSIRYMPDGTLQSSAQLENSPKTFDPIGTSQPVPFGAWQHLTLSVRVSGANQSSHATVALNGVTSAENIAISSLGPAVDQVSLALGPDYVIDGVAADVWVDNVKVTLGD